MTVSMDGNFGLVHKANAASCRDPPLMRHVGETPIFLDQSAVDDFVASQQKVPKMKGTVCMIIHSKFINCCFRVCIYTSLSCLESFLFSIPFVLSGIMNFSALIFNCQ